MSRAKEYRAQLARRNFVDLTVPSGTVFTMRRYDPEGWLMTGHVPSGVVQTYREIAERGEADVESLLDGGGEGLEKLIAVANSIICHCSHDPRIRLVAVTEDEISIDEMSWADRKFLFQSLTGQLTETEVPMRTPKTEEPTEGGSSTTVGAVLEFREGGSREATVGDGGDGADIQPTPERLDGDTRSGFGVAV